jgi:NosR/NirI family transcriptional regulator, nitrous oxide reductase regulator
MNSDMPEIGPPYSDARGIKWLLHEAFDHLWPWTRQGWIRHKVIESAGLALALAATVAWGLAASGRLQAGAIIGWWLGWSVYEVIIRLQCKPYIKVGPWWSHQYKHASRMDMISYVMFKNLLIGAAFFVALRHLGLLHTVA